MKTSIGSDPAAPGSRDMPDAPAAARAGEQRQLRQGDGP
jgi:hypothetical protein